MLCLRTILHPTNFSASSQVAFHRALALARDHEARLIILHVTPPVVVYPDMEITPLRPAGYQKALREMLENLHTQGPSVRVEYRLEPGDPDVEICRVAGEEHCDLIVMGTDGTAWLRRWLLGSLTEQVRRRAPCSVLALKAGLPSTRTPESLKGRLPVVLRTADRSVLSAAGSPRR
jgi:nucleotide-binding universal stress UspA family protein